MQNVLLATDPEETKIIETAISELFQKQWHIDILDRNEDIVLSVKEKRPEVVFLSFSPEHAIGLEILRNIREIDKDVHICVCSSINSPDLVGEVVLCDVDAYLPVPVRRIQLQKALKKISERLDEKRVQWIEQKGQENYLKQIRAVLESGFIYSVLFGIKNEKSLIGYCDALGVVYQGCILNVEVESDRQGIEEDESFNERLRTCIKKYLKTKEYCVVGPRISNRVVVYVGWDRQEQSTEKTRSIQREICRKLERDVKKNLDVSVQVEAGGVYSIKEIYHSYQEAIQALCFKQENQMSFAQKNEKYVGHREYVNMVNQLTDAVKFGKNEANQVFAQMIQQMEPLKYGAKVNRILQLIILCCHVAYLDGENELQYLDCTEFLKELESVEDVEAWAYQKFEYIMNIINENHGRRTSSTVKMAISYIETHYTMDISLEEVAKYVGISPQHFSKIFKMETGINYVDWLSDLRIEKAKQYLNAGEHTIKEICYLVGYKDPNYFSRIFKKIAGMSPSEYIRCEIKT